MPLFLIILVTRAGDPGQSFGVLRARHFVFTVFPAFSESVSRDVSQGGKMCCRCMFSVLISPLTLKIGGNG